MAGRMYKAEKIKELLGEKVSLAQLTLSIISV